MAQHPLLLLLLLLSSPAIATSTRGRRKISAILYFGDSVVDTGNNNHIPTLVVANHFPYGKDYPGSKPTGRFSNGRLVPDLLNRRLGLGERSAPFLDARLSSDDLRAGVSFASAGSGFDELTSHLSNTLPMSAQVELFRAYLDRLGLVAGDEEAAEAVANALVFVCSGSNDFTSYYRSSDKRDMDIGEYQDFVLRLVQGYVQELFELGGRQFCVVGLPPFGCTPLQITLNSEEPGKRRCVDEQNRDAQVYNSKLQKLLPALQESLSGSKIVYLDAYEVFMQILDNPMQYGFTVTTRGCCGTGLTEVGPLCNAWTPICKNVSAYVFYDSVHPTERVYRIATDYIMEHVIQQF